MKGSGFETQGMGQKVMVVGFRVSSLGSWSRFRVYGLRWGLRDQGLKSRVQGCGFKV